MVGEEAGEVEVWVWFLVLQEPCGELAGDAGGVERAF